MVPFALPPDIEAVWRPLTNAERIAAVGLIDQASTQLRLRVPGIDALVADDALRASAAQAAVVNAVKRVLINPEMAKQLSETTGPFTKSITPGDAVASGAIYFTANDLFGLVPTASNLPRTARVRSPYPPPRPHHVRGEHW